MTIPIKRMFKCDFAANCIYQIKTRENVEDVIVIGVPFMGFFDVLFDYEDKEVVFYDYTLLINVISHKVKGCIFSNIILLFAGIVNIGVFIYTSKNLIY